MKNPFDIYRGLPGSIYILFWVQVINRIGDFVVPFLSLFLVSKQGYDPKTAGLIITIAILLQIPGSLAGGQIADRFGRKITYLIAQSVSGLCILLCAFTNGWAIIGLLYVSTFFGSSVKPTINTMIYDRLTLDDRKSGYSLSYLGINLGVVIGPIFAGFLFNHYLKWFFIGDALTSFIAVLLVLFFIRDGEPPAVKPALGDCGAQSGLWGDLLKKPQIMVFMALSVVLSFIYTQSSFSLPLMMNAVFHKNGPVFMGYVFSFNAVAVLALTTFITASTKKMPYLINVSVSALFYGVGFGMVAWINHFSLLVVSTLLWTIGEILHATNSGVFVANSCEERNQAGYSALLMVTGSVGRALGAFLIGGFIKYAGIASVWPVIMGLSFATGIMLYLLHIRVAKNVPAIRDFLKRCEG